MFATNLPFEITVCGLDELLIYSEKKVSHVLSIIDPDQPDPDAFISYGEHARLLLRFHDIIQETPNMTAPQPEDIDKILAFGRTMLADPRSQRHLLVHCHMGISRSTAAMSLLIAQAQPELTAQNILAEIVTMREKAWPNLRMLKIGEEKLGRQNEFTSAVAAIYKKQLQLRPEIKDFFISIGRQEEVNLANL